MLPSLRKSGILAIGLLLDHVSNADPDTYIRTGAIAVADGPWQIR